MELLSPLTDGAAAPRQSLSSSADDESADAQVGKGTGSTIARWSSVFTKVCAAALIDRKPFFVGGGGFDVCGYSVERKRHANVGAP